MRKYLMFWELVGEERLFDEKTRCGYWVIESKDDLKIKCVCEKNKLRKPSFLEFHRKSLAGENMICGALEIQDDEKQRLLKKKFICLFEDGFLSTRIELQYSCGASKSYPKKPFVIGVIIISDRIEASLDLTELVHLTNSDYSSLKQLSSDMEKLLYEKSYLANVSLKCGSVSIPASKNILSARSPVFEAMFRCPMKEAMENNVVIEDVEVPVLQAMLKYMYTGKTEDLTPTLAPDLLIIANKYLIGCLESTCSKYLMSNMSKTNVASILLIGDFVSPDIKNFAINFLCNKCDDHSCLENNKDWIALKESKPHLMLEIFSAIVKSQEQKLKMRS